MDDLIRCDWARGSELERIYHDTVWGRPERDDHALFKMLCLEGMQAGLSWSLILRKMEGLCAAFADFDPAVLAAWGPEEAAALMSCEGIIRNRLKIAAVPHNARIYGEVCARYGSLGDFLWAYVDGRPIQNQWKTRAEVPATTPLSDRLSRDLKKLGFKFVGSTIVYAYMQAIGMVNDHLVDCAFYEACAKHEV